MLSASQQDKYKEKNMSNSVGNIVKWLRAH